MHATTEGLIDNNVGYLPAPYTISIIYTLSHEQIAIASLYWMPGCTHTVHACIPRAAHSCMHASCGELRVGGGVDSRWVAARLCMWCKRRHLSLRGLISDGDRAGVCCVRVCLSSNRVLQMWLVLIFQPSCWPTTAPPIAHAPAKCSQH
jgi:hypothetical protein